MKNKPIYKLMDSKGRVLIPKELRTASGMLMCFLFTYLAIIAYEIIKSLSGMF